MKEHFNNSSYAIYLLSETCQKFVCGVKLWFCTTWKGLGFFDIWVMFHTLLRDVDPYIIIEQLWKIGMKTSELRYKKSKRIASHGFFSYIPVSKITLEDIQSMYLFFWWEKKKKVTQLKITPHEKNFRVVGGGGEIPVVRFFTVTTWDFLFKCKDWMSQNLRLSKFCGPIPTRISFSNVCR